MTQATQALPLPFPSNGAGQHIFMFAVNPQGNSFKCTLKASLLSSQLATTKDDCVILLHFKMTAADWKQLLTRHHPP